MHVSPVITASHDSLVFVSCSPDLLCQERPSTAPAGSVQLFLDETRRRALHTRSSQNNMSSMKGAGAMVTAEVWVWNINRAVTIMCRHVEGANTQACNLMPSVCAASSTLSLNTPRSSMALMCLQETHYKSWRGRGVANPSRGLSEEMLQTLQQMRMEPAAQQEPQARKLVWTVAPTPNDGTDGFLRHRMSDPALEARPVKV